MRKVVAIGVGQSDFGKFPWLDSIDLGTIAVKAAIRDSGIDPKKLQVAYGGRVLGDPMSGGTATQEVLKNFGISQIEITNVTNACATGFTAAHRLWMDIAYGIYDIGIAVGMESMTANKTGMLVPKASVDSDLGLSVPGVSALQIRRLMLDYGATLEDLAYPAVKNRNNGCLNPHAMFRNKTEMKDITESPMISDPLTKMMCCANSDGAAAIILCEEKYARQFTTKFVNIEYSILESGRFEYPGRDVLVDELMVDASQKAYEATGIGPEDINVVELHDAFAPEEYWAIESLHLCEKGKSIELMRQGYFDIGGKLPVSASGGLMANGHPLGASGIRVINEIVLQLRGDAGAHQVEGAKVGLAQMEGGYVTGLTAPVAGGVQIITK